MSGWLIVWGLVVFVIMLVEIVVEYEADDSCCTAAIFPFVLGAIGAILYWTCTGISERYFGLLLMLNFGAFFIAGVIETIVEEVTFEGGGCFCGILYAVLYLICLFVSFGIFSNSAEKIIALETPVVEETRYVLWNGENDLESEDNGSNLIHVIQYINGKNESYYKFYYAAETEDGEIEAVPYEVKESDVKIILHSNGVEESNEDYLLVTSTKYYSEDRSKEPPERICTSTFNEYRLYLRESTFENMTVVVDPTE